MIYPSDSKVVPLILQDDIRCRNGDNNGLIIHSDYGSCVVSCTDKYFDHWCPCKVEWGENNLNFIVRVNAESDSRMWSIKEGILTISFSCCF